MRPIERAARAVVEEQRRQGITGEDDPALIVRAALLALREPSELMRLAGGYTQKYGETEEDRYAYSIWQAMIDAALSE